MYIQELILENFEGIEATMHVRKIRIQFQKRKNKICLITGPNGHGKTVLLSQLTPFATLGNMDVRDDLNLIIEGESGYKKVVIIDKEDTYLIEHFYSPNKGSHSVKSYLKKNGIERNPNGNVTSFKEQVKECLDIEQDYMKLVRLGNNVSNLITLKGAERKSFMSKLLDDTNIYLKYYKKINLDVSVVKSLLSHLSDKLRKTNITDLENSKTILTSKKNNLEEIETALESVNDNLSVIQFQFSQLPENLEESLREARKKFHKLKDTSDLTAEELREKEKQLSIKYAANETREQMLGERISSVTEDLDAALESLEEVKSSIQNYSNAIDVGDLKRIVIDLRETVRNQRTFYETQEEISHHVSDMEELLTFLREKQEALSTTYEFGREPIGKVVSLMKQNANVGKYIADKIAEVEALQEDRDAERFIRRILHQNANLKIPDGCPGGCQMIHIIKDMIDTTKNTEGRKERSREFYSYMSMAYTTIKNVLLSFGEKKALFERLPKYIQDMFKTETLLNHIANTEWIYDQKILFNELSFITDHDNYLKNVDLLEEKEKELDRYLSDSRLPLLKSTEESLIRKIQSLTKMKANDLDAYRDLKSTQKELQEEIKETQSLLTVVERSEEIIKTKRELEMKYEEYQRLEDEKIENERKRHSLVFQKTKYSQEITDLEYNIQQFKSIQKEMRVCEKSYDELVLIRDALSSTKGIPLIFIDLYLKKAKTIVNDLLFEIYHGKMEIDRFNISATEFTIPFIKDGKIIKDIIHASQGEQSFFSIALSFAISFQSMSRYNIMLLDELDSVLDEGNREHFISILEKLMEMIGAEQIFIISHNNMFSMYPVDYLSVIDKEPDNRRFTNYLPIEKTL